MVLDSNIIIYAVEAQNPKVLQFIANNRTFVSPISKVEVLGYHNVSPANKQNLEAFFQKMPTLAVSDDVIDEAISLRQTRKMSLGDALIAGTALANNMPVVTANTKDFNWISKFTVIDPT